MSLLTLAMPRTEYNAEYKDDVQSAKTITIAYVILIMTLWSL